MRNASGIGPRNVPENCDAHVGTRLLDHARQQREVVILHEEQGVLDAGHFVEHGVREFAVGVLVALPIRGTENRAGVGDVAQRPEPFVREPVVVALFFFLG